MLSKEILDEIKRKANMGVYEFNIKSEDAKQLLDTIEAQQQEIQQLKGDLQIEKSAHEKTARNFVRIVNGNSKEVNKCLCDNCAETQQLQAQNTAMQEALAKAREHFEWIYEDGRRGKMLPDIDSFVMARCKKAIAEIDKAGGGEK